MRLLTVWTFVCAVALCAGRAEAAQASVPGDPEKAQLVRQILDVTHAADQMITAIEASLPAQRAARPALPTIFWDRFIAQARQRRTELIDAIVPVWSGAFTLDELRGLLQFYQGPLGQRLLEVQPGLLREAAQAGQRWGNQIGNDVGRQLAAEGVKLGP